MTCPTPAASRADGTGRQRARRTSRWWLAGLLVGCLLPTTLGHAEALRLAEQITQICLMAPAAIREESRRARKRASHRWPTSVGRPGRETRVWRQVAGHACSGADLASRAPRAPPFIV
ncbi:MULTISPECIES: hypothetical protein [Modicisalibacter]|uniref:Uncharacterized protein n=1 Tax=Modicisalibacter tunisiensis TaxID=390637 RepID=A0ABS7WZV2_9GAMM|nr:MULTISPECIES: hypothetical protein [Modicisalibacter]MBZ9568150.1 hypothetical protein [Modicisalibacter tunisiensis]